MLDPIEKTFDEKEAQRRFFLAVLLVVGAFSMESALAFFGFSPRMSGELIGRIMGTVDSMAVMAMGYYFQNHWASNSKKEKKDERSQD